MYDLNRLLIVDDDPAQLDWLELLLQEDYAITLAASGKEALSSLAAEMLPDLILLDICMPEMSGHEVFTSLRKQQRCRNIPVIFFTGLDDTETEVRCLADGAADYIAKPVAVDVLKARIKHMLRLTRRLDRQKLAALPEKLTEKEIALLQLMALNLTNEEISSQLNYSYGYVKQLTSRLLHKLSLASRRDIKRYLCGENPENGA